VSTLWRYLSHVRAHYKRSKHLISIDWFRLYLSSAFEDAACTNAPEGVDPDVWGRLWTAPESPTQTRASMDRCLNDCPALPQCRVLVSLGAAPRGVVQAGHAYGMRVSGGRRRVPSEATPETTEDEAC